MKNDKQPTKISAPLNQTASQIVATRGLLPRKVKLWRSLRVVPGVAASLSFFFVEGTLAAGSELEGREARKGGLQLSLCPTAMFCVVFV